MRLPHTIERLYLDFDGFFASVEQLFDKSLRGRPVGVVPFAGTDRTCMIACSREAKAQGVKNVMSIEEAKQLCPDIIFVPQKPDLYRRAHNALMCEIETVLPIDTAKSIDELTCKLDSFGKANPLIIAQRLKKAIAQNIGSCITASIGFAANRQLAKMACKLGKPDGCVVWRPEDLPEPLFALSLEDIPGVGSSMQERLFKAGIMSVEQLYNTAPKEMRKIWKNVTGERLWYALHGYDIQAPVHERRMFGHGRVLPPELRNIKGAEGMSRLLLIKAGRRLRRENFYAGGLWLYLSITDGSWLRKRSLTAVNDDHAILKALASLWDEVRRDFPNGVKIFRLGVTLYDLSMANTRQLDLFCSDDESAKRWEKVTRSMDHLNQKYSSTVVSLGSWDPPAGGHVGGKISYTRIPSAEDFW